jgi:hypothetical protein
VKVTLILPVLLNLRGTLITFERPAARLPARRPALTPLPFSRTRRPEADASPSFRIVTRKVTFRFRLTRLGPLTVVWPSLAEGTRVSSAVTARASLIVTWQVPVPEQPAPDQPTKREPVAAVAVKVTASLVEKEAVQASPQSIPPGEEMTWPVPVPDFVTVRVGQAEVASCTGPPSSDHTAVV